MANRLTAEEILPLIAALPASERVRLLQLVTRRAIDPAAAYDADPPGADEFSADGDSLGWDTEGWERFA